jgi:hypothetical protein
MSSFANGNSVTQDTAAEFSDDGGRADIDEYDYVRDTLLLLFDIKLVAARRANTDARILS